MKLYDLKTCLNNNLCFFDYFMIVFMTVFKCCFYDFLMFLVILFKENMLFLS